VATLNTDMMFQYTRPVQDDLQTFDNQLNDYLRGDSPLITSIARHLLKSRGKRIRPAFLFLSSRAADNFSEYSVQASLAIELIHTATLLHDDVVDESELRRGQETVNSKWTNLISVLMGDYLFAKAFRIMVETGSIELVNAISKATERVSIGELRQIEETGNYALSEEEYLEIIADKTASLFAVSCETGPILSARDDHERERFALFGEQVGTAFQIADDLLDFVGDSEITGKEPGNDLMTGMVTLPLIYSLRQVSEKSSREVAGRLRDENSEETVAFINRFVNENGGIDYAYRKADELCQRGLESISSVSGSQYFDSLAGMVEYTTGRSS
jgi:octaprenyl-diphosphate synthase